MLDILPTDTFQIVLQNLEIKDLKNLWKTSKSTQKAITNKNYYRELFAKNPRLSTAQINLLVNDPTSLEKLKKNLLNIPSFLFGSNPNKEEHSYNSRKFHLYFIKPLPAVTLAMLSDNPKLFVEFSEPDKFGYANLAAICGAINIYKLINPSKTATTFNLQCAVYSKNIELVKYICENQQIKLLQKNLRVITAIADDQNQPEIVTYLNEKFSSPEIRTEPLPHKSFGY